MRDVTHIVKNKHQQESSLDPFAQEELVALIQLTTAKCYFEVDGTFWQQNSLNSQ
jgi:hypothetical protein